MYQLKEKGVSVGFSGISQNISGPISDDLYKAIIKKNKDASKLFEKVADAPADKPGENISVDPQPVNE
jgi:hypothetical protein